MELSCRIKRLLIIFVLFLVFSPIVSAASLSLTKIGALSTGGATYSEWWYSNNNPMLSGTAGNNATVNIKIDDNNYTTTADASGNWSYQTTLGESDPVIVISSGDESYTFTLHVGQVMPESTTNQTTATQTPQSTVAAVPQTGFPQAAGLIVGLSMITLGFYSFNRNKQADYEKTVFKSLE